MKDSYALNINNQTGNSENYVKLLGIEKDNTLCFGQDISDLCKKASNQLNTIGRITFTTEITSTWALRKKMYS